MDPQLKAYLEAIQAGMMGFTDAATFGHGPQVQAGVNAMIGKVAVPSSDLGQNYDDQLKRVQDYYSQYVQQHPAAMAVGSAAGNFAPFAGEFYQGFGRAPSAIPRTPDMPVAKPMQSLPQEPPLQGMSPGHDLNIPYEKPTPFAPDERGIYNREPYPEEMQSFRDAQHSKQLEEIKSRIANAQPPQADVVPYKSLQELLESKGSRLEGQMSQDARDEHEFMLARAKMQDTASKNKDAWDAKQRAQRNQSVLENIKQNGGKYRDKYGDMGSFETTPYNNGKPTYLDSITDKIEHPQPGDALVSESDFKKYMSATDNPTYSSYKEYKLDMEPRSRPQHGAGWLRNFSEEERAVIPEDPNDDEIHYLQGVFARDPDNNAKLIKKLQAAKESELPYVQYGSKKDPKIAPNYNAQPLTGQIGTGKPTTFGTDPFGWYDAKYGSTKKLLGKYKELETPVEINTSSDLIAHDDYIEQIPEGSRVILYSQTRAAGYPSDGRLLTAGKKLEEAGFDVEYHGFDWSKMKDEGN